MCWYSLIRREIIGCALDMLWFLFLGIFIWWACTGYIDVDWLYKGFFILQIAQQFIFTVVRCIVLKISAEDEIEDKLGVHCLFEFIRSIFGIANILLMIFVFKAWHFYYHLVDGGSGFFVFLSWILYAHIVFWASFMPLWSTFRICYHFKPYHCRC